MCLKPLKSPRNDYEHCFVLTLTMWRLNILNVTRVSAVVQNKVSKEIKKNTSATLNQLKRLKQHSFWFLSFYLKENDTEAPEEWINTLNKGVYDGTKLIF